MIEVEKEPRKINVESEDLRTFNNEGVTPRAQVLKITEKDMECPTFEQELLAILK